MKVVGIIMLELLITGIVIALFITGLVMVHR